jgi:predicted TIM-barrel fold metal-dependent hydrolase
MGIIDSDTHIDETEATWDWMAETEQQFKPKPDAPAVLDPNRPPVRYWLVSGHRQPRFIRDDRRTRTTVETRELLDPMARVRHMDELGTDVQVLYPTMFLVGITDNSDIEVATKRSYNRWLADRCSQTNGRLRWVCLPPLTDIPAAIEEVRFAKANGACGVLKKGDAEGDHWPAQEYFYPFYEECEKLDLPICFHLGAGTPDHTNSRDFEHVRYFRQSLPTLNAFNSLLRFGVPKRFSGLRWGFIEAGASWVPYAVYTVMRSIRRGRRPAADHTYEQPSDIIRLNNFYITCQVDEDLPYILQYTGEDCLLVGSDYTHADDAQEMGFVQILQERADRGEISQSAVQKILNDNPRAFYGLS